MASMKKETKLIKFVKRALGVIRKARVPFRSSKYSNHVFNNHVHLVLLVLKGLSGMIYQRFIEWAENFDGLWKVLDVERVPHFTTLHKFAGRFPRRYLDMVITMSSKGVSIRILVTGIDSTEFGMTKASYHYIQVLERRVERKGPGRPRKRRAVRHFVKVTFVVETRCQMILAVKIRRGPDSDSKDLIPAYKKFSILDDRPLRMVVADKGYDAEANHAYIREELGANTIIPARRNRSPDYKTKGKYRREMRKGYSKKDYHRRNMTETVNSVIKRKMASSVRASECRYQNAEILYMVIACNVERGLAILYVIGFLGSPLDMEMDYFPFHLQSMRARMRSSSYNVNLHSHLIKHAIMLCMYSHHPFPLTSGLRVAF